MKKFYQISVLCLLFWASNTLIAQTLPVLVKNINPTNEEGSTPIALCAHNNYLYFCAKDGDDYGIYRTDGTVAGTILLRDNIVTYNFFTGVNFIYFIGYSGDYYYDLFSINTQTSQVSNIRDFEFSIHNKGYVWEDQFYFYADTSTNQSDLELWVSTVTNGFYNTYKVKDINPTDDAIHANTCRIPVLLNNKLYFNASDGVYGYELWSTDGTETGTQMVKDIFLGSQHSMEHYGEMEVLNGQLYFSAMDNATGYELWKSNGTASGTVRVKDIKVGSESGFTTKNIEKVTFGVGQSKLVFAADDGSHGSELWVTNGTESGTYMLKDINNGTGGSIAYPGANGALYLFNYYFAADDGVHGRELWKTNGTAEGTVMVKDLFPGEEDSDISNLVIYHGQLYFTATSNGFNYHLYRTDGTEAGTQVVLPALVTQVNPEPKHLTNVGSRTLYFDADYHIPEGRELYKLEIPYQISTAAVPASGGVAVGAGDYLVGDQVTLTAMPVENYEFVHWTNESGSEVSTSATYIFTMSTSNRTYTAHFQSTLGVEDEEALGIKIYPNPADSQLFIDGINEPTTLTIFNLTGAKVMEILLDQNRSLDINHLNTGMYIGVFENSQGKSSLKFVKE